MWWVVSSCAKFLLSTLQFFWRSVVVFFDDCRERQVGAHPMDLEGALAACDFTALMDECKASNTVVKE